MPWVLRERARSGGVGAVHLPAVTPLTSPPPSAATHRARVLAFDPARDGFSFSNRFLWTADDLGHLAAGLRPLTAGLSMALPALLGGAARGKKGALGGLALGSGLAAARSDGKLVEWLAQRWPQFGLCGGMAHVAIERWPGAGRLATAALQKPHVRPLLRRRQEKTIREAGATYARYWLPMRTGLAPMPHPPFGAALLREYVSIRVRIDSGRPALLHLVGDARDPFANHQVVGFGYRDHADRAGGVLLVYDPNAPGQTRHISIGVQADDPGQCDVTTDIPTGPRASRDAISRVPGRIGMVFTTPV